MPPTVAPLRVAIFGATGAAGAGVLAECLADERVAEVRVIGRRAVPEKSPKLLQATLSDLSDLSGARELLTGIDACFYCLGIAVSRVSGEAEYRRVTYDYAVGAARQVAASSSGAVFHFLSGEGAGLNSSMMWARVKAETEQALGELGLGGLIIYRPGYIHPHVVTPGRPLIDRVARLFYTLYKGVPAWSIEARDLGKAMLGNTYAERKSGLVANREIRRLAGR